MIAPHRLHPRFHRSHTPTPMGVAAFDVFCTIHIPCVLFSGTSHV